MIFITGAKASGKKTYALQLFCGDEAAFEAATFDARTATQDTLTHMQNARVILHGEELVRAGLLDDAAHAALLNADIVTWTEVGAGIVPASADDRNFRECAGREAALLAQEATTVVRMVCGLPLVLKGPSE